MIVTRNDSIVSQLVETTESAERFSRFTGEKGVQKRRGSLGNPGTGGENFKTKIGQGNASWGQNK